MRNDRKSTHKKTILEDAWIGDAVLSLFARRRILRGEGKKDNEKFVRMTSNRFLAVLGEPSEMEAAIGRVYEREGLDAAFRFIEEKLMPVFDRQEENRRKRAGN
jgi:dsRNA-specific ribonuclease